MRSPRCHDCAKRLPGHGFHLCPARHKPSLVDELPNHKTHLLTSVPEYVLHAAVCQEAGLDWEEIAGILGRPKGSLMARVSAWRSGRLRQAA